MGGNAIQNTIRLPREQVFDQIYPSVASVFEELIRSHGFDLIYTPFLDYYRKPDYGDLDILVGINESRPFLDAFQERMKLCVSEFKRNSNILSFGIPMENGNFQVDLVCMETKFFGSSFLYYSYNDLGNLMGRVARAMGFKYGHRGLTYVYRDSECDTRIIEELEVATEGRDIFPILGYSWEKFLETEFNTLEDIFKFAASSDFFDKSLFAYENLNNENRVRNRKRKTYREFLEWLEVQDGLHSFNWGHPELKKRTQDMRLSVAMQHNPQFREAFFEASIKEAVLHRYREKFNGDFVKFLTRLEGKTLGNVMREIRDEFRNRKPEDLTIEEFVVYHLSHREIVQIVQKIASQYQ